MKAISYWKPKKVVDCTFIMTGKDTSVWSKMSGHITDGNRPISVLDSRSNHESTATFAFRIHENDVEIK